MPVDPNRHISPNQTKEQAEVEAIHLQVLSRLEEFNLLGATFPDSQYPHSECPAGMDTKAFRV